MGGKRRIGKPGGGGPELDFGIVSSSDEDLWRGGWVGGGRTGGWNAGLWVWGGWVGGGRTLGFIWVGGWVGGCSDLSIRRKGDGINRVCVPLLFEHVGFRLPLPYEELAERPTA